MASDINNTLPNGAYNHVVYHDGISIQETKGREGTDNESGTGTASRVFLTRGSASPTACRDALVNGPMLINSYDGLGLSDISREFVAPGAWQFTCNYDYKTPEIGGYTIEADTTGGQVLQTYGYDQTAFAAPGETATDYGNALDVQDGKPKGVQRVIPALKLTVRAKIATEYVLPTALGYAKLIASLTGHTNDGPMFGGEFAAGELLFIGGSGPVVSTDPQFTFTFLASQNITGQTIGEITSIDKQGHEFVWFDFATKKDPTSGRKTTHARAAYVGKVYGAADLTALSIGLAPT